MTSHSSRITLALPAIFTLATTVHAQSATERAGVSAPPRTVQEHAAALSGEPTALDLLLRVAQREALGGRIAALQSRRGDGLVLRASRATDPVLAVASGVASDLFGTGQRAAMSSTVTGSVGSMWGTDLNVSYLRQDGSGFDPLRQLAAPSTFSVGLSQSLLEGRGERAATARATRRERSALEFDERRTWQRIAASVELTYWSLSEAEATEAVRARSLALAEGMLARSRDLVRLELAPDADLLTVRSGVALRRAALAEARQARLDQSDALVFAAYGERATAAVARGMLLRTVHPYSATTDDALASPDTSLLALSDTDILTRRPDVQAVRERRDAAAVRLQVAQAGLRPLVALEGGWASVGNASSVVGNAALPRSVQGWRAGISVSAPLLNREDRGQAVVADAERDAEALRVTEAENAVRLEVRSAQRAMRVTAERLVMLNEAAQLAEQQLDAERRRQELGLSDAFRLLQTEEYAVQARLAAVGARYELQRAHTRLRLATGAAPATR